MAEKITSINSEILIWARQSSGTSLVEAEEKFGVEKLHSWENGEDYPTYTQLKEICAFYRKPVAVCFFPEPPQMKNILASCRTLPTQMYETFSRNIVKSLDEARIMQLNLYELNNQKNLSRIKITDFDFDCTNIDIVAKKLRKLMGANLDTQKRFRNLEDAFEYWRDCFYQIGIYVFKSAFQDDSVSGFCVYDKEFPIIYINNSFAMSRQIFTLFHEIFHIMYQTSGIDIFDDRKLYTYINNTDEMIEKYCNQFAGKFLVPDDDFDNQIRTRKPTDENISELAKTYRVSREVILRKYLDRNLISEDDYEIKSTAYTKDYFRAKISSNSKVTQGNYYNTQVAYKGKQYISLAFGNYYSNNITITQLSRYMNMKIPSIQTLAARKGWGTL